MKFLLKFPTRERPQEFLRVLNLYRDNCIARHRVQVIITVDDDDTTFATVEQEALKVFDNTTICRGVRTGKVGACNRDMEHMDADVQIIMLASDDMIPVSRGWDLVIEKTMIQNYPSLDGVLHFNDGYVGKWLNTFPIMGVRRYKRFGYIYHPSYKSTHCDNEFMEVAEREGKHTYFSHVLFKHEHFAWNPKIKADKLMIYNESLSPADKITYEQRKELLFPR